jgi:hypothetical protein
MGFHKRSVTLARLISYYRLQGMLGVDQYVTKPDAILIPNPERIEGKLCLELVDLIQEGKLEIAEDRLKRYSIELEILTNRMYALIQAQNQEPSNLQIREMIEETDQKLAIYRER